MIKDNGEALITFGASSVCVHKYLKDAYKCVFILQKVKICFYFSYKCKEFNHLLIICTCLIANAKTCLFCGMDSL